MSKSLDKNQQPAVRTFLSKAYLAPLDKEHFGLFRDLIKEEDGKREKLKAIGPISVLREARADERQTVVMKTVHPKTGNIVKLVEVEKYFKTDK